MSAVNKSVSMLYDLPTSRSSLLAICQQWAYNLSLKFSNMEIYGSRFFTDRIHMAHRFASFATENHDLSPFNPPWTAPEVRLSDPGRGGSPDAALVVQALHASSCASRWARSRLRRWRLPSVGCRWPLGVGRGWSMAYIFGIFAVFEILCKILFFPRGIFVKSV